MSGPSQGSEIASEAAMNKVYLKAVEKKIEGWLGSARRFDRSRSSQWTRTGEAVVHQPELEPLFGRVGLAIDDPDVGTGFYIGSWFVGNLGVYSWVAPVAAAFFGEGEKSHPLADHVVVRRTFKNSGLELVAYSDDWIDPELEHDEPFGPAVPLKVPKAPRRPRLPAVPPPAATVAEKGAGQDDATGPQSSDATSTDPAPEIAEPEPKRAVKPSPKPKPAQRPALRAASAVEAAISAPKKSRLAPVLATLQSDQYQLVTADHGRPLVVQGHPGTGKTIVASHRAAYLTHPENTSGVKRVLLFGPTEEWVRHVSGVIDALNLQDRVTVASVSSRLRTLSKSKSTPGYDSHEDFMDVDRGLAHLIAAALYELRRTNPALQAGELNNDTQRVVYRAIRANNAAGVQLTEDKDLREWCRRLPEHSEALKRARYVPFLAAVSVAITSAKPRRLYDHIIVDEAQDIRPLEWWVIDQFNGGAWTLVGDMNQRRTDHTYSSWEQLDRDVLLGEDVADYTYRVMERGYRSTQQILRFANRLLPRNERAVECLQEGPDVRSVKVAESEVAANTLWHASDFCAIYPGGRVAIITHFPAPIVGALREAGWHGDSREEHSWKRDEMSVFVLRPENARGLEFDAVVVVEPDDYPQNLGRFGPLYTSLTRANRELAVVHAKPLPGALRGKR
ncbi:MAG: AAA family ATPase [Candidatus Nanopelagicales bacterium]